MAPIENVITVQPNGHISERDLTHYRGAIYVDNQGSAAAKLTEALRRKHSYSHCLWHY